MKKQILVVDDNKSVVEILRALLTKNDYDVHEAFNAREALEKLSETRKIDLIISDVMMPGVDGFEFVRQVKNHPEYQAIPIIYLTALSSMEDEFEGFMAGAVEYVTKPFKAKDLLDKVESVFDRRDLDLPLVTSRGLRSDVANVLVLVHGDERREKILTIMRDKGFGITGADAVPKSLGRLDGGAFHLLVAHVGAGLTESDVRRFFESFNISIPVVLLHEPGEASNRDGRAAAIFEFPINGEALADACRRAISTHSGA